MITKEIEINNRQGLHARPATLFVQTASRFKSDVRAEKDGSEYNCKSLISVLSMGATMGAKLVIKANGEDEREVVDAMTELSESNFGE
jgi:phosphotransferase system HPr (HPr) family protein